MILGIHRTHQDRYPLQPYPHHTANPESRSARYGQVLLSLWMVCALLVANALWISQPLAQTQASHGPYSEQLKADPTIALLRSAVVVATADHGNTDASDAADPPWLLAHTSTHPQAIATRQRHYLNGFPAHHLSARYSASRPRAPPLPF